MGIFGYILDQLNQDQLNPWLCEISFIVTTVNPVFNHWSPLNITILILGTESPSVT